MTEAIHNGARRRTAVVAASAAVLLAASAASVMFARAVWSDEAADVQAERAASDQDMAQARAALADRFPNASAMTSSGVFTHGEDSGRAVCGRVDIEQPDDGFDGPERFVFVDGGLTVEEAEGTAAVEVRWKDVCEG